ncbi:MAG TPA: hypothetical protein VN767_04290 [Streptosporangiaceae bacterium]|nr:hypothetical protein [Streptosporangiaceae bacterium]
MISDRRRWIVLCVLIVSPLLGYGIIGGGDASSWTQRGVLVPIALGLAVLAPFCVHESRTEHPALSVRLFRDPRLSSAATAISLNFFAMAGVYFFMSFYRQNVRGYSPLHAGLLTTPAAIGQLVAARRRAPLVSRDAGRLDHDRGLRCRADRVLDTGHPAGQACAGRGVAG